MCREPWKQGEPKSLRAAFLYLVPSQRLAGLRINDSRGLRPVPRTQRALRESVLWRLFGGRIGQIPYDVLKLSFDSGQSFAQLRDVGEQPLA